MHKSYFPYEYFDDLGKLSSTEFPRYQDFYSSLKGRNTLEPTPNEALSAEEQLVVHQDGNLTADQILAVGVHRYETLRDMFRENNWTFGDLLAYYNNRYKTTNQNVWPPAQKRLTHKVLKCLIKFLNCFTTVSSVFNNSNYMISILFQRRRTLPGGC